MSLPIAYIRDGVIRPNNFLTKFVSEDAAKEQTALLKSAYFAYRAVEVSLVDFQNFHCENFDPLSGENRFETNALLISLYTRDKFRYIKEELRRMDPTRQRQQIASLLKIPVKCDLQKLRQALDCYVSDKVAFVVLSRLLFATDTMKMVLPTQGEDEKESPELEAAKISLQGMQKIFCDSDIAAAAEELEAFVPKEDSKTVSIKGDQKLLQDIANVAQMHFSELLCDLLKKQADESQLAPQKNRLD